MRAPDDYGRAGPQDVVLLAVKAHQVDARAADVRALFGPDTMVVTMQNGMPWWYFHKHGGAATKARRCAASIRGGAHRAAIEPERVIGCVVYPASELLAPGVVRIVEGNRFPLGELDGARAPRVAGARGRR